MKEEMNEKKIR